MSTIHKSRKTYFYCSPSDYMFYTQDKLAKCKQSGKDIKGYINTFFRYLVQIIQITKQGKVDRFLQ